MNSIHRVGITLAGVVTALTVAGVFVVDGYANAMAKDQTAANGATESAGTPAAEGSTGPTIIYVRPSTSDPAVSPARGGAPGAGTTLPPTARPTPRPATAPPATQPPRGDDGESDD
jgi:hypothetical protein